ncbi:protein-L-isoaspartate O-methyltransferase family protein [Acetobacter indonesiensis]|uniref:protein-L-isoaspartate O-methyltransferase family protein n=1 Tax=Acetobacter indonesiensis TaxID=104101 RepID=UPI0039E97870
MKLLLQRLGTKAGLENMNLEQLNSDLLDRQNASQETDLRQARNYMVDDQLRPSEITDPQLLQIMRTLPREECIPLNQRSTAYADITIPLGDNRFLPQPLLTARIIQACLPVLSKKILVVGAATGYSAAIFQQLGAQVVALESNSRISEVGKSFCSCHAPLVKWIENDLNDGAESFAPFDLIYFEGRINQTPDFCIHQLSKNGRLAGVMTIQASAGQAFLATQDLNNINMISILPLFDCSLPLLPNFEQINDFKL